LFKNMKIGNDHAWALQRIIEREPDRVNDHDLKSLVDFLEVSLYFFGSNNSVVVYCLSDRLDACKNILYSRGIV
jgi:hypothetical protein